MMTETCPCGKSFVASRSDARFCSSTCRSAAHQGRLAVAAAASPSDTATALVEAVRNDLRLAGCVDTALGLAALELAAAMGRPGCPPAAMPGLAKQLMLTLEAAKRGTKISAPQALRDELARRRAAQMGGAS